MPVNEVGFESRVQRLRIRPTHHLVLQLGIGEAFEILAEPVDLIALGDDDINGKTKIKDALDDIKLLGDLAGFGGDLVRRILDQAVGRYDEEQPVDGTIGAVLFEQLEK